MTNRSSDKAAIVIRVMGSSDISTTLNHIRVEGLEATHYCS